LPARPIERGRPGPGLLAHVLVAKYGDHLPLYRQSQIFARDGIDLDRSTLAGWVGRSTALLEPLAAAIGRHALGGLAIFTDDTPIKLQAPGEGRTSEPPPLKWSTLRYGFGPQGGSRCRARGTSPRRSSPSCARWTSWSRKARAWPTPCARSA
jgi:hypothetical protein